MFNFGGTEFKSKSSAALSLLKEGKGRMEISKSLGITYQTVHAIMMKNGLKPAKAVKTEVKKTDVTNTKPKKEKKTKKVEAPVTEQNSTL